MVEVVRQTGSPRSRLFSSATPAPSAVCRCRSSSRGSSRSTHRTAPAPIAPGFGTRREVNADLVLGDHSLSILEGVVLPWGEPSGYLKKVVLPGAREDVQVRPQRAVEATSAPAVQKILLTGAPGKIDHVPVRQRALARLVRIELEGRARSRREALSRDVLGRGAEQLEQYMVEQPLSPPAAGARLKPESLSVLVAGRASATWWRCRCARRSAFFSSTCAGSTRTSPDRFSRKSPTGCASWSTSGSTISRSSRSAVTLSGGEAQRIRLATQIGSRLVGVLYILDEPSIGLHQRDNARLLATLKELRDLGNTVLVVEHDEETIRSADYVVDLGPRAGRHGGEVVAAGAPTDVSAASRLTHRALSAWRAADPAAATAPDRERRSHAARRGRASTTTCRISRVEIPARTVRRGDGRVGVGKVDAGHRHPVPVAGAPLLSGQRSSPARTIGSKGSTTSTR